MTAGSYKPLQLQGTSLCLRLPCCSDLAVANGVALSGSACTALSLSVCAALSAALMCAALSGSVCLCCTKWQSLAYSSMFACAALYCDEWR